MNVCLRSIIHLLENCIKQLSQFLLNKFKKFEGDTIHFRFGKLLQVQACLNHIHVKSRPVKGTVWKEGKIESSSLAIFSLTSNPPNLNKWGK